MSSEILKRRAEEGDRFGEKAYHMYYLFGRMGKLQGDSWRRYAVGAVFAALTGMVYPAFGIVYGKQDDHPLGRMGSLLTFVSNFSFEYLDVPGEDRARSSRRR